MADRRLRQWWSPSPGEWLLTVICFSGTAVAVTQPVPVNFVGAAVSVAACLTTTWNLVRFRRAARTPERVEALEDALDLMARGLFKMTEQRNQARRADDGVRPAPAAPEDET